MSGDENDLGSQHSSQSDRHDMDSSTSSGVESKSGRHSLKKRKGRRSGSSSGEPSRQPSDASISAGSSGNFSTKSPEKVEEQSSSRPHSSQSEGEEYRNTRTWALDHRNRSQISADDSEQWESATLAGLQSIQDSYEKIRSLVESHINNVRNKTVKSDFHTYGNLEKLIRSAEKVLVEAEIFVTETANGLEDQALGLAVIPENDSLNLPENGAGQVLESDTDSRHVQQPESPASAVRFGTQQDGEEIEVPSTNLTISQIVSQKLKDHISQSGCIEVFLSKATEAQNCLQFLHELKESFTLGVPEWDDLFTIACHRIEMTDVQGDRVIEEVPVPPLTVRGKLLELARDAERCVDMTNQISQLAGTKDGWIATCIFMLTVKKFFTFGIADWDGPIDFVYQSVTSSYTLSNEKEKKSRMSLFKSHMYQIGIPLVAFIASFFSMADPEIKKENYWEALGVIARDSFLWNGFGMSLVSLYWFLVSLAFYSLEIWDNGRGAKKAYLEFEKLNIPTFNFLDPARLINPTGPAALPLGRPDISSPTFPPLRTILRARVLHVDGGRPSRRQCLQALEQLFRACAISRQSAARFLKAGQLERTEDEESALSEWMLQELVRLVAGYDLLKMPIRTRKAIIFRALLALRTYIYASNMVISTDLLDATHALLKSLSKGDSEKKEEQLTREMVTYICTLVIGLGIYSCCYGSMPDDAKDVQYYQYAKAICSISYGQVSRIFTSLCLEISE